MTPFSLLAPTSAQAGDQRWQQASALLLQRLSPPTHATMITLARLFHDLPGVEFKGPEDVSVRALCIDSRRVATGAVFFALPGRRTHGLRFMEEAMDRGAAAIVTDQDIWVPRKMTLVRVPDVRAALVTASRRFYDEPQRHLHLVGVTGTSGKTVVTSLLHDWWSAQTPTGLLGTIHYALGNRTLPANRTTPEPIDLYAMFAQMHQAGCKRAVMEVSSHALDQERVRDLAYETVAFLNLTPEHLDYHGSMEGYFESVARLFDGRNGPAPRQVVINLDDPYGDLLISRLPQEARAVTFGRDERADLRLHDVQCTRHGATFKLQTPKGALTVHSPLVGEFNVDNVAAALAVAYAEGTDLNHCVRQLARFAGVRGRLELVNEGQDFSVIVDYAHTPQAYRRVLKTLRAITPGRLLVVFGCGGDRDPARRPEVTRVVAEEADLAWATADNPRSEQLADIFRDMRAGLPERHALRFLDDRRHAISQALDAAQAGDTVLIAGKGHETFQQHADSVVPFDDRAVARQLLRYRRELSN
ncbi:MAG: UDP-N-acetylmuramoyl-L-alanyl-D-glutamate--2,6-diaminopimelate ligase [Verrucomicrobiota bacterium JB022]|nr:UDP-N-acetylmuramoyl-L-alanyl-D-glutamate--2,6-diaminopimelate ligase [Verrucomicrobiota bacterium JB022]